MILWINGAYGSGKSTIARALHKKLDKSFLYNPENSGNFIRENVPERMWKDDFQDYPMWRQVNVQMLKYLEKNHDGIIIVPMTIVRKKYYDEVITELRAAGVLLMHIILLANRETLFNRLIARGEETDSWCVEQIDRCVDALNEDIDGIKMDTNNRDVASIVSDIKQLI